MCIRDRLVAAQHDEAADVHHAVLLGAHGAAVGVAEHLLACLLYTSDAADERSSVDLGGRRIIKKKKKRQTPER